MIKNVLISGNTLGFEVIKKVKCSDDNASVTRYGSEDVALMSYSFQGKINTLCQLKWQQNQINLLLTKRTIIQNQNSLKH